MKIRKDLLLNLLNIVYEYTNSDNDIEWITVKGNHIPIAKGRTKEESIREFIEQKSIGGYSESGKKSNRAIAAELSDKDTITKLSKKLKIPTKELDVLYPLEWHHIGKSFKKENYYPTEAYLDLQKNNKISQKSIDKYDLNKQDIYGIEKSWEKLQIKLKNSNSKNILEEYKIKYNNPIFHSYIDEALSKKKNLSSLASDEIRRSINYFRAGEIDKNKLDETLEYWYNKAKVKSEKLKNEQK